MEVNSAVVAKCRPFFSVKDLFWVIYLFPVRWLSAVLPPFLFVRAGMLLDPVSRFLYVGARQRMEKVMGKSLGLSREECRELSGSFVRNFMRRSLDDLVMNRLAEKGEWRCDGAQGLDKLEQALAAGKGVVLVTGHFFANRLAKRYLDSLGFPCLSVRNGAPPDLNAGSFGKRYLQPRYVGFLHEVIRDEVLIQDPELTLKIMKRLRAGGIVNVHLDGPSSVETVSIPFLGSNHEFSLGFLRIAGACGAMLLPMHCRGNSDGFTLSFESPISPECYQSGRGPDRSVLSGLVGRLESRVRSNPDEWEVWDKL